MALPVYIPLLLMLGGSMADYDCICNYNSDLNIYTAADPKSDLLGHLYEFDCKPKSPLVSTQAYFVIQFEKQVYFAVNYWKHLIQLLLTKSITKKQINICMAEIQGPGRI